MITRTFRHFVGRQLFSRFLALGAGLLTACLATGTGRAVTLAWDPSSDGDTVGYRLYYGFAGEPLDHQLEAGTNTTATVTNLVAGRTYSFVAKAYNAGGLESTPSNEVQYKVPFTLQVLEQAVAGQTIALGWDISPDGGAGYRLYWGTASGSRDSQLDAGTNTTATVSGLAQGETYYFTVIPYDTQGAEGSAYQEFSHTVPALDFEIGPASAEGARRVAFSVVAGITYELQATEDLQTWVTIWQDTATTDTTVEVTDSAAEAKTMRFYRMQY